jgi:putative redox protein
LTKGWDIPEINISLNLYQESDPELTTTISRSLFPTEIEDIKKRLLIIAEKCPVSKQYCNQHNAVIMDPKKLKGIYKW